MNILDLTLLGVIIASNNMSFALGLGAIGTNKYHMRILSVFTITEFTIPLIGLLLGRLLSSVIADYAGIIGSLILISLGFYTVYTVLNEKKGESVEYLTSFKGLVLIALGLSTDNLVVGFSLGLRDVNPLKLAFFIASCSMLFTFIGLKSGKYIKNNMSKYIEALAGILLMVLGILNYFGFT